MGSPGSVLLVKRTTKAAFAHGSEDWYLVNWRERSNSRLLLKLANNTSYIGKSDSLEQNQRGRGKYGYLHWFSSLAVILNPLQTCASSSKVSFHDLE